MTRFELHLTRVQLGEWEAELGVQTPAVRYEVFKAKVLAVTVHAWHLPLQERVKVVHPVAGLH